MPGLEGDLEECMILTGGITMCVGALVLSRTGIGQPLR